MQADWPPTAGLPPLGEGAIQIWRADLDALPSEPEIYLQYLSPEELVRTDRLRAGQVRLQFVAARACLRVLLGNNLHQTPHAVPIHLGKYGKPETPADPHLHFNVAHSRSTILIALSRMGRVGVDLEYFDRKTDHLEIARSSFTEREHRHLASLSGSSRLERAFFHCWTRKEAVVKADGRGLSLPLNSFEVPLDDHTSAHPVSLASGAADNFFVSDISLGPDLVGAIALETPHPVPSALRFPPPIGA